MSPPNDSGTPPHLDNNHDIDEKNTKGRPLSTTNTAATDHSNDTYLLQDGPTPLCFSINTGNRKRWIILFFSLIFIESCVLPLILFYSLEWGAHLSITKNLAIITSLVGTFSGFELAHRTLLLWFRSGHESRRPIGAGRWGMDFFNIHINLAMGAFFIPLIIGSSLTPASVPVVAMALPCFMLTMCVPLLITGIWAHRLRVPFRVSSLPRGEPVPPLTYTIVEDVCAVDGGGLIDFRQAWRHRYEESRILRKLCRDTAIVWGASGVVIAVGLIFAGWYAGRDTGYGLCYSIPWVWAMVGAALTVWWTRRELAREAREWDKPTVHRERPLKLIEDEDARAADARVMARRASRGTGLRDSSRTPRRLSHSGTSPTWLENGGVRAASPEELDQARRAMSEGGERPTGLLPRRNEDMV